MSRCEVLQWLREAAHFLQGGMRVSWFSAAHEGSGKAERSCELSAKAGGDEAMWRTWLTRVAQAAGVVQAGVGQTGRRGAGGRAAGGVRGTSCGFRRMICSV